MASRGIFDRLVYRFSLYRDASFEKKLGIRTSQKSQIILKDDLSTSSPNKMHATAYQGVLFDVFANLMEASKKNGHDLREYSFVDVGSGMGKACFCASFYDFKKISGFDFDPHLVARAKANLEIVKTKRTIEVDFYEADATGVILPIEPTFIFLYHPFNHIVMQKFLNNNIKLFEVPVLIGYANDQYRFLLEQMGLKQIHRNKRRQISLWSNT